MDSPPAARDHDNVAAGIPHGIAVSVIIPARNEENTIALCLRAFERQSIPAAALEVIVVVAGEDRTMEIAERDGTGRFGRFELLRVDAGNKNVALQAGCARAQADAIVLVDADTELAGNALEEILGALRRNPSSVVHGAATPRYDTWVSRYWEFNRKLTKDLRFDGILSGEIVALARAALRTADLTTLFPADIGTKCDLHLGRVLRRHGWQITYVPAARATTYVPTTFRGLLRTMLRSRRGAMAVLPLAEAALQAAWAGLLLAALPATLLATHWSRKLAFVCAAPLVLHGAQLAWRVEALRRRGLGDYRRESLLYLGLDLIARGLKLWAFAERLAGRQPPATFRGERPPLPAGV